MGHPDHGRLQGSTTKPPEAIYQWQRVNPQPLNLGRIGFVDADGARLCASDLRIKMRHLDLWSGVLSTQFEYLGEAVSVETCVDPKSDTVAVHVASPLLKDGRLRIMVDFPAPSRGSAGWAGDFLTVNGHRTEITGQTEDRLKLSRTIDDAHYFVEVVGSGFKVGQAPATPLKIFSARYGAKDGAKSVDVTEKVAALIKEGGLVCSVSNRFAGSDPAPQVKKELKVTYRLNETEQTKTFREGDVFNLGAGPSAHRFIATGKGGSEAIDLTCKFEPQFSDSKPNVSAVKAACIKGWSEFWQHGGAIDLSASKDPRWKELERRIVLSQYQLAVQSAGDNPPAEAGLTRIDGWESKWHFEMIWWHLAHYALWDRWPMADKALSIYQRTSPVARAIAQNFDYKGLMWPKSTGPNGYNDGGPAEMALLWKQPHPIFLAELEYRLQPTAETLAKWKDVVFGTAEFMADYPTRNVTTGFYDLYPVWPVHEGSSGDRRNSVFELGYWRSALEMAQQWRLRFGLDREPHWDDVVNHLAPLPVKDGLYIYDNDTPDTFKTRRASHVDMLGLAGMLPPFKGLDPEIAHRTVTEVGRQWNWDRCWGWDFPWMAMAAARVGEPKLAIDALFNPSIKNRYDERGLCTGGPAPYLPGNGGLLYAVAMMAAGWDGAPAQPAPGFPNDGSWTVKWEGLKPAP